MPRARLAILSLTLLSSFATSAPAATQLGDWGHFISYKPKMLLNNPDGRAFSVTVHVMQWGMPRWNKPTHKVTVTGPGGATIHTGATPLNNAEATIAVPAGNKGVYTVEPDGNVWVSSTLDHSVLWTGKTGGHMVEDRRAVFQASVPRRWWFWVPPDVTEFTAKAQRADRYMSQREDWGYFIISPRGQRIRALWGQPPLTSAREYRQEQIARVEVEPGAAGRFWCLEVSLGDSHNYSNINFCLDGVPPYIARSPEEWFDPRTGNRPEIPLYDETPFIQSARLEGMKDRWPHLQHFSPCPSLGDPDGIEILGDGRYALWNPEGRTVGFRIGTYLPRRGRESPDRAHVWIVGPRGNTALDELIPMIHVHGRHGGPTHQLDTGKGVSFVEVTGVERWLSFTYPAMPMVMMGEQIAEGAWRFRFTACAPRNWYFHVPSDATRVSVRALADHPTDVIHLEICAPDRTMALIYGSTGERTIEVPPELAGKMWYLRPSVGSASRMVTASDPPHRYQDLPMTIELSGVEGYLAPTWEQWFDPRNPRLPDER